MHLTDFEEFSKLISRLCEIYAKKPTDELIQAFWEALKDQPFGLVRRLAEQHIRQAKFFPKPVELRPKLEKPAVVRDAASDAAFREGEERAIRNLEELRQKDPDEWERRVALAKGADCNAIRLHHQYGNQLWYDLKERCWRV